MREIKFRAWDITKKEMYYSDDEKKLDGSAFCIFSNGEWRLGQVDYEWSVYGTGNKKFYGNGVLMQYTGLKDKNGKGIYEGDIVANPFFDANVAVIWNDKFAQFTFGGAEFNVEVSPTVIEVLGNIYENPELLTP